MTKPLNIAFVIIGAFAVVLIALYWRAPRSDVRDGGAIKGATDISRVDTPTQVPKALAELVDFSKVKPYNVQKRILEDGSIQEVLSFDTGHLRENYESLKKDMVGENKFSLKTDTFDSGRFTLSFERGSDRLEVVGVPKIPTSLWEKSTIIISFYYRP